MKRWFARVLEALKENRPSERRRAPRKPVNGLDANYFAGGGERAYRVSDVSLSGAFIESPAQWGLGTLMTIVFQADPPEDGAPVVTIAVQASVTRTTSEGFGIQFIFPNKAQRLNFHRFLRQHGALVPENPKSQNRTQTVPIL